MTRGRSAAVAVCGLPRGSAPATLAVAGASAAIGAAVLAAAGE